MASGAALENNRSDVAVESGRCFLASTQCNPRKSACHKRPFHTRLLLELKADLRLHRARTLVRGRDAETRATRLRERLNDVAARVVWKIGYHRVGGRTGKDRSRVPVRDSRLIECIEKIQSHRNRQAFLAPQ